MGIVQIIYIIWMMEELKNLLNHGLHFDTKFLEHFCVKSVLVAKIL